MIIEQPLPLRILTAPVTTIQTAEELLLMASHVTPQEMAEAGEMLLNFERTMGVLSIRAILTAAAVTLSQVMIVYAAGKFVTSGNNRQEAPADKKRVRTSACVSILLSCIDIARLDMKNGYETYRALETGSDKGRTSRNYRSRR